MRKLSSSFSQIFLYGLLFILIVFYSVHQYLYTPTAPFGDDLPTMVNYVFSFEYAKSLGEKLYILIDNKFLEHRLMASSIISLCTYYLTNVVSMPLLATIGGFFWISLLYFFRRWMLQTKLSLVWLLPISFVLLSSASFQTTYWPTVALQHFMVIFLTFLSIHLLTVDNKLSKLYFSLSILIAYIATFSSGNGMMVWASGLFILFVKKEFKYILFWAIACFTSVFLYFQNLLINHTPSSQGINFIFKNWHKKIFAFLASLGGMLHAETNDFFFSDGFELFSLRYTSIYLGMIVTFIFLYFFYKSFVRRESTLNAVLGCMIFIFLTTAMIALGRTSSDGNLGIFRSRYYTYSIVGVSNAIFLLAFLTRTSPWHKWLQWSVVILTVLFWGAWQIASYHKLFNHNNMLACGYFNWKKNKTWVVYQTSAYYENYFNSSFEKIEKEKFPLKSSNELEYAFDTKKWIVSQPDGYNFRDINLLKINEDPKNNYINLKIINDQALPISSLHEGYAIAMASKRDTFLLWSTVSPVQIKDFIGNRNICNKGYKLDITLAKKDLPKGDYLLHQFYYLRKDGFIRSKPEGKITL